MTSVRVSKDGPAYQALQRHGWRQDIEAATAGDVWMNAPGRFRCEVGYETPNGAQLSITDALSLYEWRRDGLRGFVGQFCFEAEDEDSAVKVVDHAAAVIKRCDFPEDARLYVELYDCDEAAIIYRLSLSAICERTH